MNTQDQKAPPKLRIALTDDSGLLLEIPSGPVKAKLLLRKRYVDSNHMHHIFLSLEFESPLPTDPGNEVSARDISEVRKYYTEEKYFDNSVHAHTRRDRNRKRTKILFPLINLDHGRFMQRYPHSDYEELAKCARLILEVHRQITDSDSKIDSGNAYVNIYRIFMSARNQLFELARGNSNVSVSGISELHKAIKEDKDFERKLIELFYKYFPQSGIQIPAWVYPKNIIDYVIIVPSMLNFALNDRANL